MKKLYFIGLLIFFNSCYTYQENDLDYFEGEWKIKTVSADGQEIVKDYGTVYMDKYGKGTIEVKYLPYNEQTLPAKGIFNVATNKGKDLFIKWYGAMWLDENGKASQFMCRKENELTIKVEKMKRKSMTWTFDELLTSVYGCDLNKPFGKETNVVWKLEKK